MTLTPQQASIIGSASGFVDDWCVYEHWYGEPEQLIYVGICRLVDVFHAPDARTNSEWHKTVQMRHTLHVRIIATGERVECYRYYGRYLDANKPPCNRLGRHVGAGMEIMCVQTGERFATQSDAARALGVSQASISQNLNSLIPATKGGFQFRRVPRNSAGADDAAGAHGTPGAPPSGVAHPFIPVPTGA
jgi:hypothetical protein